MDQECSGFAGILGVPVQALRVGDRSASNEIRNTIDKLAQNQNLSPSMRDQLLSFFDKGMAAARERSEAQGIVSRLSGAMGGGPRTTPSGSATTSAPGASTGGSMGHAAAGTGSVSSSDADALRAHDSLRDLVQFAHGSNAGSLASEAEGLAWLIAAQRFMSTAQLPPKLKVLAAEPLFDTLLGVPAPAAAKGNPQKFSNRLWSQYLSAASRAAREGGTAGAAGVGGVPPATGAGDTGATSGATGRAARGGAEMNDWRQIVGLLQQRIDTFAQQIPPSDLRQTMAMYAQELRAAAVGGGPAMRPGNNMQNPTNPMNPMNHNAPKSAPHSGQQPGGGASSPGGGTSAPSGGGSSQPGGGY